MSARRSSSPVLAAVRNTLPPEASCDFTSAMHATTSPWKRTRSGREFELGGRADVDGELLEMRLGSLRKCGGEFFFIQKEMRGARGGRAAMAFIDRRCLREMFFCCVAQVLRFVQEDHRFKGAFRQFEERTLTTLLGRSEERSCFPGWGCRLCCADERGDIPFRQRQKCCSLHGRDRSLSARVKFAHRLDSVS